MHLYIIRHGECSYRTPDSGLTEKGREQALKTAEYFSQKQVQYIFSSPLIRALETAQPLAMQKELPITVMTDLREGFSNSHTARARQELQDMFPKVQLPYDINKNGWLHGNDHYVDWKPRCENILKTLYSYPKDSRIAVFTHGGFGNYLLHSILGLNFEKPIWFELANCSITKVRFVPDPKAERPNWPLYPPVDIEVHTINKTTHLQ